MPETLTITLSEEARELYDRLAAEGITPERMVSAGIWLADQCQRGNLLIVRNAAQAEPLWLESKPLHWPAASFLAAQKRRRPLKDVLNAEEDIEITEVVDDVDSAGGVVTHLKPRRGR